MRSRTNVTLRCGNRLREAAWRHWHWLVAGSLAFTLRLPGVLNGLPYIRNADEPLNYRLVHAMVTERRALPGFYDYPSLQYGIQAVGHAALAVAGQLVGVWESTGELAMAPGGGHGAHLAMSRAPWILARTITLVVGVVGVVIVAHLAASVCRSRRCGAFAGGLAAVSGIGYSTGHLLTPDALAGTSAIATIAMIMRLHIDPPAVPDRRWVVITGVCFGLAMGAKYNNILLAPLIIAAAAVAPAQVRPGVRHVVSLLGVAGAVFLMTTPAVLFDSSAFFNGLDRVITHYGEGHPGSDSGALAANLEFLWGSDPIAVVLAAIGVLFVRRRSTMLLAGWVAGYLAVASSTKVSFDRNLTPILGALAVVAAIGGQWLWRQARNVWRTRPDQTWRRVAVVACGVALLLPVAVAHGRQLGNDVRRDLHDHLAESRRWVAEQLPPGAAVLAEYYAPWIDRQRFVVESVPFAYSRPEQSAASDVVVVTSLGSGRYERGRSRSDDVIARLDTLRASACEVRRFDDGFGFWVELLFMRCADDAAA